MTNMKKIGLSALAGTLASFSAAQAGEMSVSGSAELTYTHSGDTEVTGNPLGQYKAISFSGSGELDNGYTFSVMHAMNDAHSGLSSSNLSLDMGSLGSLNFDAGTGGYGATAVDNVMPTAWEEADHGLTTGLSDVGKVSGAKNILNWTSPTGPGGSQLQLTWAPRVGASHSGDGATSQAADGAGIDAALKFSPVEGLTIGAAGESIEVENACSNATGCQTDDEWGVTAYAKYAFGPVTVGYQKSGKSDNNLLVAGVGHNEVKVYGVSFNVNDNFSISYQYGEDMYHFNNDGHTGGEEVTAEYKGYAAAYTMGPLALKVTNNQVDNRTGNTGSAYNDENTEISLSMAF